MAQDDEPFVPRWTLRALRREWGWRRRTAASRWSGLPALVALVASLACFVRTFQLLSGLRPAEAEGLRGASHGGVVGVGMSASVWLVAAVLLLGLVGVLAERPWAPRVGLKRRARTEDPPARPRAPPPATSPAPRLPPGVRRPRAARTGEAADPTRGLLPAPPAPVVSADEALGAFALSRLDALVAS